MRQIDADRLKAHYAWWNNEEKELFDAIVDQQPTVVEVVRCGECKHRDKVTGWCADVQDYISNTNWFCAGGEMDGGADDE